MLTDFGHSAAHVRVRVEQVVVLLRLPVRKCGQLLRDGLEQANNNANRSGLHVGAEFVHSRRILKEKKKKIHELPYNNWRNGGSAYRCPIVRVKLHLFPHSQQDTGQDEDDRPVLQPVATVHTRVETRKLFQNILLQFTPHVGHRTLDLEVDHHGSCGLAIELGRCGIDLAREVVFLTQTLDHGNVKGQVIGDDQFQSLADHRQLSAVVVAESCLEHLGQEWCPFEVVVDEFLKCAISIDVTVEVVRQHGVRNAFHAGGQLGRLHLILGGFPMHRLNPVDGETLLVADIDLASVDWQNMSVTVGDKESSFVFREPLDVAHREAQRNVTFVVRLPVLHEVTNLLDINPSAWHLPETSMRGLATGTGLTLVTLFFPSC